MVHPFCVAMHPEKLPVAGSVGRVLNKSNALLLFLNSNECAKIKPIRTERKGENHVYYRRTWESKERI